MGSASIPVGAFVERVIDTERFLARVTETILVEGERMYTVVYVDDGREEQDVPYDEVERAKAPPSTPGGPLPEPSRRIDDCDGGEGKAIVHGFDEVSVRTSG